MTKIAFTIGEVAGLLGITAKTIRYYHKIGLITEPLRDTNNYRYYSVEQLEEIQIILRLKSFGLSLKQIILVVQAGYSNQLIRNVLEQQERKIKADIMNLQSQLSNVQSYLSSDVLNPIEISTTPNKNKTCTTSILADSIKPISNGLSDVLIAVEGDILSKIDLYKWEDNYEQFVHDTGKKIAKEIIKIEGLYIFWMERYLSLASMEENDLQGNSWLLELGQNPVRKSIAKSLQLPPHPEFSYNKQKQLQKLLLALLYQNNTGLQQKFLRALIR